MDVEQWNDLADVADFDPNKPSAEVAFDFLEKKVKGREWTMCDLGSGTGAISVKLSPLFKHITMVDFSQRMLERARKEAMAAGAENIGYRLQDLSLDNGDCISDLAFSCACPVFYRIPGARRIERFASKACVLIMPTLAPDSVITEILDEAGVRMMKTVDAELVAEDRSMEHDVSIVKFLEERETMTLPVIKNRCLRYTDGSEEANVRIDEVLSSYSDGELCIERWSALLYWEL